MSINERSNYEDSLHEIELRQRLRYICDLSHKVCNIQYDKEAPPKKQSSWRDFYNYLEMLRTIADFVLRLKIQDRIATRNCDPAIIAEPGEFDPDEPNYAVLLGTREQALMEIEEYRSIISARSRYYESLMRIFDLNSEDPLWPNYRVPQKVHRDVKRISPVRKGIVKALKVLGIDAKPEDIVRYFDGYIDQHLWNPTWEVHRREKNKKTLTELFRVDSNFRKNFTTTVWKVKEELKRIERTTTNLHNS